MKVLSDILHKAGILKEGAEAYSSGGYSVVVRNATTQRFETVASTAFANIYTANGTLTGNRVVSGGGFSLTLNPVLTFGERLTGITDKTFINGYTGGTSTRKSIFTINDSVTQDGGTFYEADASNSRIYGTNTGISTGGIVSLNSFRHNIYLRGLTPSALIQSRNFIEQIREDSSDVSTNGNNAFEGLGVYQTHWQTAGSSISTNRFWGFNHSAQIRSGTLIDNSSYRSIIAVGQFTSNVTAVTNHYAFIAQATVGVSSGPTATITNYYGLYLNTPTVNATGTCLLYTSPSPRDRQKSRMPSSA